MNMLYSRRSFAWLMLGAFVVLSAASAGCASRRTPVPIVPSDALHQPKPPSPAQAKQWLVDGNARFVAGTLQHPNQTPQVRSSLAAGQAPFAVVLGCADSRTSPEVLFDRGLGDLFIARVAGNIVDDALIGSIEYAVEHLHAPLIVVMGHSKCGAVNAARDIIASDGHAEGHIEALVRAIAPAVEQTVGQDAAATGKANVRHVVQTLRTCEPVLAPMVAGGRIEIIGAYYDLDTGVVAFLPD